MTLLALHRELRRSRWPGRHYLATTRTRTSKTKMCTITPNFFRFAPHTVSWGRLGVNRLVANYTWNLSNRCWAAPGLFSFFEEGSGCSWLVWVCNSQNGQVSTRLGPNRSYNLFAEAFFGIVCWAITVFWHLNQRHRLLQDEVFDVVDKGALGPMMPPCENRTRSGNATDRSECTFLRWIPLESSAA